MIPLTSQIRGIHDSKPRASGDDPRHTLQTVTGER